MRGGGCTSLELDLTGGISRILSCVIYILPPISQGHRVQGKLQPEVIPFPSWCVSVRTAHPPTHQRFSPAV